MLDEVWAPRDRVLALLDELAAEKAQRAAAAAGRDLAEVADGYRKEAATAAALRFKVAAAADKPPPALEAVERG
ncbi:hypothetical protein ACGFJT_37360 [Actinomadura geliboluensis]|uniref:hypothetical protein n=1 Tax=Actinomadura geliboluensis TaxID=882440 RepID=UPI00372355F5